MGWKIIKGPEPKCSPINCCHDKYDTNALNCKILYQLVNPTQKGCVDKFIGALPLQN